MAGGEVPNTTGVGMVARHRLRTRWRSVLALTLLVGVVGGLVLGTVAGARRTGSALSRFEETTRSADMQISTGEPTEAQLEEFAALPAVEAMAVLPQYLIIPDGTQLVNVPATVDDRFGTVIDRSRVIEGRQPDPDAVDEIAIGEGLADLLDLGVGDRLHAISATPEQVALALAGEELNGRPSGPELDLEVVGIVRRPLDLSELGSSTGLFVLTPAFNEEYADRIGVYLTTLRVRTVDGEADLAGLEAEADRIFGDSPFFSVVNLEGEIAGARNAIDVLELALWIFAGVAALAGAVAIGIVLSREISQMDAHQPMLSALGLTRRQRVAVHAPMAIVVALGGGCLAVLGAIALSPRFPIDVARRAEPDLGVDVDGVVLAAGTAVIAVLVLAGAVLAAVRSSRRVVVREEADEARLGAGIVGMAARAGLPPTISNGVRMAFHRGHGRSAVPLRSAIVGGVFGVLGVTAGLVFAASLQSVIDAPQRFGWTWDVTTEDQVVNTPCGGDTRGVEQVPGLEAVAELCYGPGLQVDGRTVPSMAFRPLLGTLEAEAVEGRVPSGPDEIALGAETLDVLDKEIGDTVSVAGPEATRDLEIVGQVVLPPIGLGQPLADGAVLTGEGNDPFFDLNNYYRYFVARYAPDADRDAVDRAIEDNPALLRRPAGTLPADIDHLRQVNWVPVTLAALLAVLSLLAVGHALVSSVRRRRGELALLKTFGFSRRQVRASVAWQAAALALVGLGLGIPLGLALGNVVWRTVAERVGIATITTVPVVALVLMVPAALLAVVLVAFLPARSAARTIPAVALRSD